jgi:hypothetical protein
MPDPIKSRHSNLLNDLVDMQDSAAYALRRSVLQEAEQTILRQERQLAKMQQLALESSALNHAAVDELKALVAHLKAPDFARLAGMRMSEMTEAEQADALEGWLRTNVRSFDTDPSYKGQRGAPHNHIEFLLQRIDHLRSPK